MGGNLTKHCVTIGAILGTGITLLLAQKRSAYLPVANAPKPGRAPGLKVQLLTRDGEEPREYALVFGKGDELASGLVQFAQDYQVTSAHFTGVGALHDVTVGWMDRDKKAYKAIPILSQVEVLTLAGDIAQYDGKPAVHTHLVVGTSDGSAKGGHLLEAHVFPTLEVMVTVDPAAMKKTFDPETGLALIDPDTQQ
jgi:predicted DNA-binding protein with PD1-like motif